MVAKVTEAGPLNDSMKVRSGEQGLLLVVLTPSEIDVRFFQDAGNELLDQVAECVEDTQQSGWGIA